MAKAQMVLHRIFEKGAIKFELPENAADRTCLAMVLRQCQEKNNDYVLVTLQKPRKPRTTGEGSQNHHLNGHIMQICSETGNDYETVKNCIKMKAVELMGYPYKEMNGVITPKHESDCDTQECAMLIEAAHLLAADLEIILKETTE